MTTTLKGATTSLVALNGRGCTTEPMPLETVSLTTTLDTSERLRKAFSRVDFTMMSSKDETKPNKCGLHLLLVSFHCMRSKSFVVVRKELGFHW